MDVRLCITTYNRPAELVRAVEAAWNSDLPLTEVVVIDNSPEHYAHTLLLGKANVVTLPANIGFGPSLNLIFAMYDDYIVYANDDVEVHPHTVRELVEHAERFPSYKLLYGDYREADMWSLFLLRKQAFLEAGPFDPAIWPLYYDDMDMLYRLRLLGYEPVTVHAATYDHLHNGTLKACSPQERALLIDRQVARNAAYYQGKWGGPLHQERFRLPFDGGRPVVPPLIKR